MISETAQAANGPTTADAHLAKPQGQTAEVVASASTLSSDATAHGLEDRVAS